MGPFFFVSPLGNLLPGLFYITFSCPPPTERRSRRVGGYIILNPIPFGLYPFKSRTGRCAMAAVVIGRFYKDLGEGGELGKKKEGGHFTLFDVILLAVRIEEWKNENSKVEKNEIFSNFYDPKRLFVAELMCVRAFPSRSPFHPQDFNVHIFVRRNNKIKIYPQWKTQHTKIFTSSFRLISDTHIRNSHFFSI